MLSFKLIVDLRKGGRKRGVIRVTTPHPPHTNGTTVFSGRCPSLPCFVDGKSGGLEKLSNLPNITQLSDRTTIRTWVQCSQQVSYVGRVPNNSKTKFRYLNKVKLRVSLTQHTHHGEGRAISFHLKGNLVASLKQTHLLLLINHS